MLLICSWVVSVAVEVDRDSTELGRRKVADVTGLGVVGCCKETALDEALVVVEVVVAALVALLDWLVWNAELNPG